MRQNQKKQKPLSRKTAAASEPDTRTRRRRNAWEPQVIVPQQVDLPLTDSRPEEVAVPAAPNGRSLIDGRL